MSAPLRVGIVGFGVVGQSTAQTLAEHAEDIHRRTGQRLAVTWVCRRTPLAPAAIPAGACATQDWRAVVAAADVDVVVETVGGVQAAAEIVRAALEAGKPVVTANKNLLAARGDELFALAQARHIPLGFEAAVAGGVPVVRAIAEGAAGDRLIALRGILNGTANYILTRMEEDGLEFETALGEAQRAGYAEADPTLDVEGIDARDKLAILARLAFGARVEPERIARQGIRGVTAVDAHYARALGGSIRLIAAAERGPGGVDLSVRPWLLARNSMLARVTGVNNAVLLTGARTGTQLFSGPGAGGPATSIAVVSDLIEIAAARAAGRLAAKAPPGFGTVPEMALCTQPPEAPWYMRLTVADRPGIVARVAAALAEQDINIDAVAQEPGMEKSRLSWVVTTEPAAAASVRAAQEEIEKCDFMRAPILLLRSALKE
ncbi:MAG TPA: homoserine dehydrogenase [Terriglobales bacterium]|nr:homoserine dehydrogenase [Terriglobales bacterium]